MDGDGVKAYVIDDACNCQDRADMLVHSVYRPIDQDETEDFEDIQREGQLAITPYTTVTTS